MPARSRSIPCIERKGTHDPPAPASATRTLRDLAATDQASSARSPRADGGAGSGMTRALVRKMEARRKPVVRKESNECGKWATSRRRWVRIQVTFKTKSSG